jgi:hypothetical protein
LGWSIYIHTACNVFTPDYIEDFTTFLPNCWEEATEGDPTTGPSNFGSGNWNPDGFAGNGNTGAISINLYTTGFSDWIISPLIDVTGGSYQVEFDFSITLYNNPGAGTLGSDDEVQFLVTADGGTTWITLQSWTAADAVDPAGEHMLYDLSGYTGVLQFAFWGYDGILNDTPDNDIYLDNFQVRAPLSAAPECSTNETVTVDPTCGNEDVPFAWDATTGADGYNVFIGTTLGGNEIANPVNAGLALTYILTDVLPGTDYYWTVVPYNTIGDATGCTEQTFTTFADGCLCIPAPNLVDGNGITNVTMGTINNTTGAEVGNYADYTAQVTDALQGVALDIDITLETGYTYNLWIWVDWNDNGTFADAGEEFYLGESLADNPTTFNSSIAVPVTVTMGNHIIRIGGADNGLGSTSPSDPCYIGFYGSFEDYTLNVTAAASCVPVSDLAATNITGISADIEWTSNGTETVWDIEVVDAGTTATGIPTANDQANPYSLTVLTEGTSYDVYVRSDCGMDDTDVSDWVMFTFSTLTGCAMNIVATPDPACGNYDFPITWDATPGATGYNAYLGLTAGANDIANPFDIGNFTALTLTAPDAATDYYFTIVPYNASGEAMSCTEIMITTSATQCLCIPSPPLVDGIGITNVTMGTINNNTVAETDNYGDYTAMVTDVMAGPLAIDISLDTGFGYTYHLWAWIDWNNDGDFADADEEFYLGESLNDATTTFNGSITVPATAAAGNHIIRIGGADTGLGDDITGLQNPCYSGNYAAFEDYTLNVVIAVSCAAPTALDATNITDASADLSWTTGDTETVWSIEYGTTGFTQGTGTVVSGLISPDYALTGLMGETDYDYYACADCGVLVSNLVITGVIDGPLSGGMPKAIEFYVLTDIADLSAYGLGIANNGGGTDGQEIDFPAISLTAGQFYYVASNDAQFTAFFGFAPDLVDNDAVLNGDNAVELFKSGQVVDVFGDINVGGTGTTWNHRDRWVYRNSMTGADGSTFVEANWSFSGTDALDGEVDNATAATPFPIGIYVGAATPMVTTVCAGPFAFTTLLGCNVVGGIIETTDPTTICVDGIGDPINVTLTGNVGGNSQFVITAPNGEILGLPGDAGPFDLDGAGPGVCTIWHLSYEDGLTGAVVGNNVSDLVGCFNLSNGIEVTRYEATTSTINSENCAGSGFSIEVNGTTYDETNPTGMEVMMNAEGCDSTITINLAFVTSVSGTESYEGCSGDGYAVDINGTTYDEANPTGMETLTSVDGCDSIVTVNLVFLTPTSGNVDYAGCAADGFSVDFNGNTYDEANPTGVEVIMNEAGCDSIITINLTFDGIPTGSSIAYAGCSGDGYSVDVNGITYNEANPTGTEVMMNAVGCDSTITVALSYSPPMVVTIDVIDTGLNTGSIDTTVTGGTAPYTFVWSNGATYEDLSGLEPVDYTVTVTDINGCEIAGEPIEVSFDTAIEDIKGLTAFNLQPNPASSHVTVVLEFTDAKDFNLDIVNTLGQVMTSKRYEGIVQSNIELDVNNLSAGVYFVRILTEGGDTQAVKRLVINK